MCIEGGRPDASACATCARPISPPSMVTKELLDMFWALNGATRTPRLRKIRQRAVAVIDLPTSLPVPRTIMDLAMDISYVAADMHRQGAGSPLESFRTAVSPHLPGRLAPLESDRRLFPEGPSLSQVLLKNNQGFTLGGADLFSHFFEFVYSITKIAKTSKNYKAKEKAETPNQTNHKNENQGYCGNQGPRSSGEAFSWGLYHH